MLTLTVLAVLSEFGIQTTSLVAILGAASLAVGLALQGTLSNLAAGVMLLIFRPFRISHKVQIGGNTGIVKALSLFWTELVTDDQVQVIVPNSNVWGQPLRNFSIYPTPPHTAEVRFKISEDTGLDPRLKRCAVWSKPIRASWLTLPRACCSTTARQRMRSRSSSHSRPGKTWRRS